MRSILITTLCVLFAASVALGDWDPNHLDPRRSTNHKMHFPQMPDLTDSGLDVLATFVPITPGTPDGLGKILADDWRCSHSGPVTDFHIWGSWLSDKLPPEITSPDGLSVVPGQANVKFKLSIHADIPAVAGRHSRPGIQLWQDIFEPGDPRVKVRLYADDVQEQFYDPNFNEMIGTDTKVWQYNFILDPTDPNKDIFRQEVGKIYWLDLQAWPDPESLDPDPALEKATFGWKTTLDNFNDDAVFGDNDIFGEPPNSLPAPEWTEMLHPITGESLNLAFVITPEPATMSLLVLGGIVALSRRRRR